MTPIPITAREKESYALNQPDMLRVSIATGNIIVDKRSDFFGVHAPKKGTNQYEKR